MLESFRAGEARRRPEDHPLLPPPRFDVGSRVMCCVEEDEEIWLTGTVTRHWAQQEGMVCPYVVQVDEDNNIFVNRVRTDVDRVISAVNRFRAESAGSAVLIEANDEASHGIIVRIWDDMSAASVPVSLTRASGQQQ